MKLIFVVAADLDRDESGKVIVGPETETVCREALWVSGKQASHHCVLANAGIASKRWNGVHMGALMAGYIRARVHAHLQKNVRAGQAKTFNTWGEMEALARFVKRRPHITEVILVVRWWHAPRAHTLCRYWFYRYGLLKTVAVNVHECPSNASWLARAKERFLAVPRNWLRMREGKLPY